MTKELIEQSRKRPACAELAVLVTTVALTISLVIAATAVSIGIARADALAPAGADGSGRWALAVLAAVVVAGLGGLAAAMMRDGGHSQRRA